MKHVCALSCWELHERTDIIFAPVLSEVDRSRKGLDQFRDGRLEVTGISRQALHDL